MRRRPAQITLTLLVLTSTFLGTACGTEDAETSSSSSPATTTRLYGADGNMSNSFGDTFTDQPAALVGMKGTTPLTPLTDAFKNQLLTIDSGLAHFSYTGEAYDAVAIAAIAAEYGKTTDPVELATYIVGVTTGGTLCDTIASCLSLARKGTDLQYRGVALRHSGLSSSGEPLSATYGAVSFARDNHIDDARTEYVNVGDVETQDVISPSPGKTVDGVTPLKIGGLLPHSGRLSSFGPPLSAAIRLAIDDVNAAGGVLSSDVVWIDGDDGTNEQTACATVDDLVDQGVQVIVGAGASGVTQAVIPRIVSLKRVLISPTSTSDELSTVEDSGLFFRTAPPDSLQAKALADIIMRDGPSRVAIAAIDEAYGNGLSVSVQSNLILAGIADSNIRIVTYPAKDRYDAATDITQIFNPVAADIMTFGPTAVLIVGSDESAYIVRSLLTQ